MSSEKEERYFDTPRGKKISPRYHKLDKFKLDMRWEFLTRRLTPQFISAAGCAEDDEHSRESVGVSVQEFGDGARCF